MASRDKKDLREDVREAWQASAAEYKLAHSGEPQPFLTCTYRSSAEQDALYAIGRTKPGKKVTNAKAGQSNHNSNPSRAFDIGFQQGGKLFWDNHFFERFAVIAKSHGLSWGGDWTGGFRDKPHFEGPKL